jgi:hypothetical protein
MGQDTGVPASCWLAEQGTGEARAARTRRLAALLGEMMAETGCGYRSDTEKGQQQGVGGCRDGGRSGGVVKCSQVERYGEQRLASRAKERNHSAACTVAWGESRPRLS